MFAKLPLLNYPQPQNRSGSYSLQTEDLPSLSWRGTAYPYELPILTLTIPATYPGANPYQILNYPPYMNPTQLSPTSQGEPWECHELAPGWWALVPRASSPPTEETPLREETSRPPSQSEYLPTGITAYIDQHLVIDSPDYTPKPHKSSITWRSNSMPSLYSRATGPTLMGSMT